MTGADRSAVLDALAVANQTLQEGDERAVAEGVVAAIQGTLEPDLSAVLRYDEEAADLRVEAIGTTSGTVDPDAITLPGCCHDVVWEAFVTEQSPVWRTLEPAVEVAGLDLTARRLLGAPVGRHGAVLVGWTRSRHDEEAVVPLVSSLAGTASAAFGRRDLERTIERQNEQLRHLAWLNRIVRGID